MKEIAKNSFRLTEYELDIPEYNYSEDFDTLEDAQKRLRELYQEFALSENEVIIKSEIDQNSAAVYLIDGNEIFWNIEEI